MDLALLMLRVTLGTLLTGHGGQKLFGWFKGPGPEGTKGFMQALGLRPPRQWAILAGGSEFLGGVLTLLGFLNPLGPLSAIGAMGMATARVHWGKPIWVTEGGAELPVTNIAIASALATAGPGKFSLDRMLHTRLPRWTVLPGLALAASGIGYGIWSSNQQQQQAEQLTPEQQASEKQTQPA